MYVLEEEHGWETPAVLHGTTKSSKRQLGETKTQINWYDRATILQDVPGLFLFFNLVS
jgi:hypothetical protein